MGEHAVEDNGVRATPQLAEGASVLTSADGQVLVRLDARTFVRLDGRSRLTLHGDRRLVLHEGRVFTDSTGPGVVVETPAGVRVSDVGTQFDLAVDGDRVTVGVREGRVNVAAGGVAVSAAAREGVGEVVTFEGRELASRKPVPTTHARWDWIHNSVPRFRSGGGERARLPRLGDPGGRFGTDVFECGGSAPRDGRAAPRSPDTRGPGGAVVDSRHPRNRALAPRCVFAELPASGGTRFTAGARWRHRGRSRTATEGRRIGAFAPAAASVGPRSVHGTLDGVVAPAHSRTELRRQRVVWVAWGTVPILTLATVGLLVGWIGGWRWDRTAYHTVQHDWFLALNDVLSSWPTVLWSNLTLLGDGAVLAAILSPLVIWHPRSWGSVLAAVPFAALLSGALKKAAAVPRPGAVLDPDFTVIGDLLTGHNSLPSGHAITAFTAAVAVLGAIAAPNVRRWWYGPSLAAGLLIAATVGLSRGGGRRALAARRGGGRGLRLDRGPLWGGCGTRLASVAIAPAFGYGSAWAGGVGLCAECGGLVPCHGIGAGNTVRSVAGSAMRGGHDDEPEQSRR